MVDKTNEQNDLSVLSDDQLDTLVMVKIKKSWQKVARIIAAVMSVYNTQDEERLLIRIKALVEAKKIESIGDLDRPRFSEVRIPPESGVGQFDEGIAAYSSNDFVSALKIFEPLALNGEAGASWRLGEMYAKGFGVTKDIMMAEKWYRRALEQGYLPAQESLNSLKK